MDSTLSIDDFTDNDFKMYPNATYGKVYLGIATDSIIILDYLSNKK